MLIDGGLSVFSVMNSVKSQFETIYFSCRFSCRLENNLSEKLLNSRFAHCSQYITVQVSWENAKHVSAI